MPRVSKMSVHLHLHSRLNLPHTTQGQVLLETQALRNWELQCSHVQVIAPQTPSKIVRRNQILSEPTEGVLVRDSEIGCLVDICAFFLNVERLEVEEAQWDLFGAINPGDAQGLYEANLSREDACMRDLNGGISKRDFKLERRLYYPAIHT